MIALLWVLPGLICALAGASGQKPEPFRMVINVKVSGDPSAFDATQRHAFLSAFARVARVGYQIGDLRWDPGHFDKARGRARISAVHHIPPSNRMSESPTTVDVTIDTYRHVANEILELAKSPKFSSELSEQLEVASGQGRTRRL